MLESVLGGALKVLPVGLLPSSPILACFAAGKEVAADAVPVGERILVRPGAAVPIDGRVAHGSSVVDEGMLTGESAPVGKGPGDPVHGGSLNMGSSPLEVGHWRVV